MASFQTFHAFKRDLGRGVHNFEAHALRAYLSAATPNVATHAVKADLAEIAPTGGYTSRALTQAWTLQGSVYRLAANADQVWSASGGSIGPFRFVIVFNDTPTSPTDPLVGFWDLGSLVVLQDGDPFTLDLDSGFAIWELLLADQT